MFLELKNKDKREAFWEPTTSLANLKARARLYADIRAFFQDKDVLEVETPLLCATASLDPFIKPIAVESLGFDKKNFYLQTSPEFAMKRLLAANVGAIYQICKAFRNDEAGRFHNPEFTMLEWYRPGFDHHDLMQEVDALLHFILGTPPAEKATYAELFQRFLNINPHTTSLETLKEIALLKDIHLEAALANQLTIDDWLDILLTHCIEPNIGIQRPMMIYDFPTSKAALAKIRTGTQDEPAVGERFEVYLQGVELANGYHELLDAEEQKNRFQYNLETRKQLGYPMIPIDNNFLEALDSGMPSCAGVALGVDRLLMLKLQSTHIEEVIAFTIDRV